MSRTPARTLDAAENQATFDPYLAGWADLNRAIRRGEPWSGNERNAAFLGVGAGDAFAMYDVAPILGLDHPDDGRSAARVDIDFDGDDDIVVSSRTAPRVRVLANRLADGVPSVAVELRGAGANTDGVGAVVFANPVSGDEVDGPFEVEPYVTMRRTRTIGSGYLAQSSGWLRFHVRRQGESSRTPRVRLAVRWPDAGLELEDFGVVRAGKRFRLVQGEGRAAEVTTPAPVRQDARSLPTLEESELRRKRRLVLPSPSPVASFTVRGADGKEAPIFGMTPTGPRGAGKPAILVAWDSSEPESIDRLGGEAGLTALTAEARAAGALLVAVDLASPTGPNTLDVARTRLVANGFSGDIVAGVGTSRVVLEQLVAWRLDRPEPPPGPWSFVFGSDGRLDVVRTGAWDAGDAESDLIFCELASEDRARLAAPYGGRWLVPPVEADVAALQRRLAEAGADAAVRELDLARLRTVAPDDVAVQLRVGRALVQQGNLDGALARYDAALAAEPENAEGLRGRAWVLHLQQKYDEALDAWSAALRVDPSDRRTRANRALAAIAADKVGIARHDLDMLEREGFGATPEAQGVARAIAEADRR